MTRARLKDAAHFRRSCRCLPRPLERGSSEASSSAGPRVKVFLTQPVAAFLKDVGVRRDRVKPAPLQFEARRAETQRTYLDEMRLKSSAAALAQRKPFSNPTVGKFRTAAQELDLLRSFLCSSYCDEGVRSRGRASVLLSLYGVLDPLRIFDRT